MKKFLFSAALAAGLLATPTVADAALGDQTLKVGHRNSDVKELQEYLQSEGFHTGAIDGVFGPVTAGSLKSFQRAKSIGVDGVAGPITFSKMNLGGSSSSSTVSSNSSASSSSSVSSRLRQGDRGSEVSSLQSTLKSKGFYNSAVDGVFGPVTDAAVKDFQRTAGIGVDGVVGPVTRKALSSNVTASSGSSSSSSSSSITVAGVSTGSSSAVVETGKQYIGTPYVWGGTSTSGFDCSGFIQYVMKQHGVTTKRTVAQMWTQVSKVSSPSVGDVVFYETRTGPSHMGFYVGNGKFLHSGASTGVTISDMNSSYWKSRYIGAGRF
ncbi:C40 family peptidase [Marinococcus luteus]|uniref:C40 family peptidase n=1 Tax=Marinococcus luteus TaxID=1122204 RepID=UPI002ACC7EEE|nr:peptidoglycan-binding protein [Marinococcus luteus]MDZ5782812.1 peptidoglycan-binding protein [Marinococcus luteus]